MADQCSICLDALDGGVAALACGHRFHAACLASMAGAVGTAATTSRRGTLTACPNCRTTSRVAPVTSAAFSVGDKVLALWGYKWYPGVVDEVLEGGRAYKIAWDDGDEGQVPAAHVRAEQLTVDVDAPTERDASPPAVVTPRAAPPDEPMSPARSPLAAPSRDEPCRDEPWRPSPSSNADVVKRLPCGRTALACCAPNGELPEHYVTLDTIVLTSAKAEAAWHSLTSAQRRRARKWERAGEYMIDNGVTEIYCHRKCQQAHEYLRHGPLASVTVITVPPPPRTADDCRACRGAHSKHTCGKARGTPARSPLAAPSRDAPCGTTPSFNADAALRGGRCRNTPCGGEFPTEPSFNADVVKRLACGRTALACCASNGEIPDRYVTLDTIVLTSAKAEAAWDSLTALNRRRATKLELAGEWMIDHGVRRLYLHRECYRAFEHLRLRDPLASVTVIDTNPAPAVDVAP